MCTRTLGKKIYTSFTHPTAPFQPTPLIMRVTIAKDSQLSAFINSLLIKKQDQISDWDILTLSVEASAQKNKQEKIMEAEVSSRR